MSNEKAKNQDPISVEDLHEYLTFFLTNQVRDEKHAKELKRLARRTTTLSDVATLFKALTQHQDNAIIQLMDRVQVQDLVLARLGATEEMFNDAKESYLKILKEREEELKATIEAVKKAGNNAEESEAE